ncbi:MAG: hypothetical protein WKF91_14690 [Segetibacter sp.]
MKTIFNNWNVMRGLRLALGIFALVQAFIQRDITVGLLAGFLLFTAIANVGCCGSYGCAINFNNTKKQREV